MNTGFDRLVGYGLSRHSGHSQDRKLNAIRADEALQVGHRQYGDPGIAAFRSLRANIKGRDNLEAFFGKSIVAEQG